MSKKIKKISKIFRWVRDYLFHILDFFVRKKQVSSKEKKLLVVKLDVIGDYIIFRNFLEYIKNSEKYKDYKIYLLGNKLWQGISEKLDNEFVDEFIWVNRKKIIKNFSYRSKIIKSLHRESLETIIYPTYSREFSIDSLIWAVSADNKIGFWGDNSNISKLLKKKSDKFYTRLIETNKENIFEFYKNKDFFQKVLDESINLDYPKINVDSEDSIIEGKYAVIFPGASSVNKRLSSKNFAQVADYLVDKFSLDVYIVGSNTDNNLAKEIHSECKEKSKIMNYTGKTDLYELILLIAKSEFLFSVDSCAVHMAHAVDTEAVSVFSGIHFGRFSPYPNTQKLISLYPKEIMQRIDNQFNELAKEYKTYSNLYVNNISQDIIKDSINKLLT